MTMVLAQARDGVVTMLDGATGALRWQVGLTPTAPIVGAMRCVVDGDRVLALANTTPPSRWSAASERTYALACLDAATGARRWQTTVSQRVARDGVLPITLLVDAGRVFVDTGDALLAIDAATGAIAWRRPIAEHGDADPTYTPAALATATGHADANAT